MSCWGHAGAPALLPSVLSPREASVFTTLLAFHPLYVASSFDLLNTV